jgi:hypothetical protein
MMTLPANHVILRANIPQGDFRILGVLEIPSYAAQKALDIPASKPLEAYRRTSVGYRVSPNRWGALCLERNFQIQDNTNTDQKRIGQNYLDLHFGVN